MAKKVKVLMITHYFHPHIGGVEKHVKRISKELIKKDYKVAILTKKHDNKLKTQESVNDIEVFRIDNVVKKYIGLINIWYWMIKNRNLITSSDVIHIHDVFIWYLPLRFLYPTKPIFMTFHGYESYPIPKKAIMLRVIAERLTKGNICIGKFIEKWYGIKSDKTSYGAVDVKKFKPIKQKYKYDAIFASRLDEQTGILTYIDAVKTLKEKGVDFKLLVLGDGKYRKNVDKLAITKGFVKETAPYFQESKYAFVSRYLAILEAFASKKLVFAVYDNPLKKDYLEMTPYRKWIVIERNAVGLAEKINYYLSNQKESDQMVEEAYKWVQNRTWEHMTENYVKLWNRVN